MLFLNEHRCRLRDPAEFQPDSFQRMSKESNGKEYFAIMGILKENKQDNRIEQAFCYPKDIWLEESAREHCKAYNGIEFTPAEKKETQAKSPLITGLFNVPFAISSRVLEEGYQIFQGHSEYVLNGEYRDEEAYPIVMTEGGVAIIQCLGVLSQRVSFLQRILGGLSTDAITRQLQIFGQDPSIKSIILDIDSPGGELDGIENLAETIFGLRTSKRVIACINSHAYSAAYWIASAASEIVLSSSTAITGSIGIIALHKDISKMEETVGIKMTEIVAGKFKTIGSSHMPLDQDAKTILQTHVDYLYGIFIAAIAKYRGIPVDDVLQKMADGRIFIGQQAIDVGLASRIEPIGSIVEKEKQNILMSLASTKKGKTPAMETQAPAFNINSGNSNAIWEKAYAAGITHERERIENIESLGIPGFEACLLQAKRAGLSREETAVLLLTEQKKRGLTLDQLQNESTFINPVALPDIDNTEQNKKTYINWIVEGLKKRRN